MSQVLRRVRRHLGICESMYVSISLLLMKRSSRYNSNYNNHNKLRRVFFCLLIFYFIW